MKISVLCFDLSSNAFGRAWLLAKALSPGYDVEIIGTSRNGGIWSPMANSEISVKEFIWGRYPKFSAIKKKISDAIDGDLILASKLMPTSFGIGLQKKYSSGKPLLLDIDDWELGFFYHSGFWGKVGRFLNFSNPNGLPYVWRMERLIGYADGISVSNKFLQKKFQGVLLPHCRDTTVLDPMKFDSDKIKEKMGFKNKRVVMFLGTPRPHKGLDDLLSAFEKIKDLELSIITKQQYCDKLIGYRLVDELHELHKGKHVRWIRIDNAKLTNGGIVVDIKFMDKGIQVLCRNSTNKFIQYKYDECITFQKLNETEQVIMMAYSYANK